MFPPPNVNDWGLQAVAEENRFSKVEVQSPALPEQVKSAISRLRRFQSLEIAGSHLASSTPPAAVDRVLCPSCGQANEKGRELCWACYKPLTAPANPTPDPGQEVCIVLDGVSYRSSDPNLPDDIRVLIERIRTNGYNPELMRDWQNWRLTRNSAKLAEPPAAQPSGYPNSDRVQAFRGQRVSVLRIDGVLYRSDSPDLTPEMKDIFDYMDRDGITPALMQHLRLYGTKVKFRPISTHIPSDGDLHFWDVAGPSFKKS